MDDANELDRRLREIAVVVGDRGTPYVHAKTGHRYEVVAVALEEATLSPVVVYRAIDAPQLTWTRPLGEFQGRFVRVDPGEG
jgi:hypothetical protein